MAPKAAEDLILDQFLERLRGITEAWAHEHDLWYDCGHKDPLDHYNDEPGDGGPILLLYGGGALQSLNWGTDEAEDLYKRLEVEGVYLELDTAVVACYQFIDQECELQKAFDRRAQWRWVCRLIRADTQDVSGDVHAFFAQDPDAMRQLGHRDFERLIENIFATRGWRTELGPGSGDGGVDLRLWSSDPLGEILTLVQIKRYSMQNAINIDAVAALEAHANREGANRALFVTASRFLPSAQEFAQKSRYRLALAKADDIRQWCEENAYEARSLRRRALDPVALASFAQHLRDDAAHPSILVAPRFGSQFALVWKESTHAALLVNIPARMVSGDINRSFWVPVLDGQTQRPMQGEPVFRATREIRDGRVSYWGQRTLFMPWDGKPSLAEIWD